RGHRREPPDRLDWRSRGVDAVLRPQRHAQAARASPARAGFGRAADRSAVTRALTSVLACVGLALVPAAVRGEIEEEKPRLAFTVGKFWNTPIIGPAYTPELGFVIAGGALISYRFDDVSPRSSAPIALSYSTTGATTFTIKPSFYFLEDQLRIDAYYGNKSMTDNYFGVGYQLGNTTPIGETTTRFHKDFLQLNASAMWRIREDLYFGGSFDLSRTDATQLAAQMAADPTVVRQGTYFRNTGIGPILRYDSRDFPQN